jgi:uncharacterized protein (DUF58 family)
MGSGVISAGRSSDTAPSVLSPDEARLLDRLTLDGGFTSAAASSAGTRRARLRGGGLEFQEYRHYQPGDDPRSIDWNVEARLHQLVVRVSRAHGHLPVHVLVDTSGSMGIGAPTKLDLARKVAAALCYVAIERRDAAGVSTFTDSIGIHVRTVAGRAQLHRVFGALERAAAAGPSDVDRALEHFAAVARGPGLVAVLSDFFGADPKMRGARALLHRGLTPALLHVVAPEDQSPDLSGETELTDAERDDAPPMIVDRPAVAAYRARLAEHISTVRGFCLAHGLPWLQLDSSVRFNDLLSSLEGAGLFTL